MAPSPMTYVAFDPGYATGVAEFNYKGCNVGMEILRGNEELFGYLDNLSGSLVFIVEDFRLRSDKAIQQSGSDMPAVLSIGAIDYAAHILGATTVKVPASNHPMAINIGGLKVPSNHAYSHHIVAHNHGIYWLVKNGIRQPTQIPESLKL